MLNSPWMSPWAPYTLLSQMGSPFAGGPSMFGMAQNPFGGTQSVQAPPQPQPGPPNTSQMTAPVTALPVTTALPQAAPAAAAAPAPPAPTSAAPASMGYWGIGQNGQMAWLPGIPAPGQNYWTGTQQTGPQTWVSGTGGGGIGEFGGGPGGGGGTSGGGTGGTLDRSIGSPDLCRTRRPRKHRRSYERLGALLTMQRPTAAPSGDDGHLVVVALTPRLEGVGPVTVS